MTPIDVLGWAAILIVFLALLFFFIARRKHTRQDNWLEQHWPADAYDEFDDEARAVSAKQIQVPMRNITTSTPFGSTQVSSPEHDWVVPAVMLGTAILADHEHDSVNGGTLVDPPDAPADPSPTQCQTDNSPSYGDGAGPSGNSGSDSSSPTDVSTPTDSGTSISDALSGSYDSGSSGSDYSSGSYDSGSSGSDMGSGSDGSSGW